MTSQLDNKYFEWLTDQIAVQYGIENGNSYVELLTLFHEKEFVWIILNDDNRVMDGLDIRQEFIDEFQCGVPAHNVGMGASFLEVLLGLSRRLAFNAEGEPQTWAWQLIDNIGLNNESDPLIEEDLDRIDGHLDTIIWRRYKRDGWGGFFPLIHTPNDQRAVELWYQMMEYINEM